MKRLLWALIFFPPSISGAQVEISAAAMNGAASSSVISRQNLLRSSTSKNYDGRLVRVRLLSAGPVLAFEGQGLKIQNLESPFRPVAIPQQTKTVVRALNKGGKWFWAVKWPDRPTEILLAGKFLKVEGVGLHSGSKRLPERILLSPERNKVDVVGVVPLRDYLVGVLKSEMPLAWPLETLKAQAVAARSYALAVMSERANKIFHLESSILDQVYEAIHYDSAHVSVQKAIQAVDETRNQVLQDPHRHILKAFFHADCGGKTVSPQEVWSGGVVVGTALDHSCPNTPIARWTHTLSKQSLEKRLNLGTIDSLDYLRSGTSGRVQKVVVKFPGGRSQTLSANDFRGRLGFQDIKSTWFQASNAGNEIIFSGRGFGHGVGLCQWGSRALGQKGLPYKAILQHYYPLASLN